MTARTGRRVIPTAVSLIGFIFLAIAFDAFPLENTRVWGGTVVVLFLGMIAISYLQTRTTSESKRRFVNSIQILLMIAPWVLGCVGVVNGAADASAAAYKSTIVVETIPPKSGRSGHGPQLSVASWLPGGGILVVTVHNDCFKKFKRGDPVTIVERSGALGMRWIEGVHECGR